MGLNFCSFDYQQSILFQQSCFFLNQNIKFFRVRLLSLDFFFKNPPFLMLKFFITGEVSSLRNVPPAKCNRQNVAIPLSRVSLPYAIDHFYYFCVI
jgi:hypothetical protein